MRIAGLVPATGLGHCTWLPAALACASRLKSLRRRGFAVRMIGSARARASFGASRLLPVFRVS